MSSATSLTYGLNDTAVRTTLASDITSTDTSFDVGEVTNAPATPFLIAVWVDQSPLREDDMEMMEVTSISGTTLTVNRGQKGTAAQSFSGGDKVFMGVASADLFDEVSTSDAEIQDAAGTREIQQSLNELAFSVAESQFNQNLTRLGYDGGLFHIFEDKRDVTDNTSILSFDGSVEPFKSSVEPTPTTLTDALRKISEVAFGPSDQLAVAVGSTSETVYVYDSNLNLTDTLTDASDVLRSVAFDQNDGRLAVGTDSGTLIYDSDLNFNTTLSTGQGLGVAFNQNNGRLAVGSGDNSTYVYDSDLNLIDTLTDAEQAVEGVAFDQNDGRLATGTANLNTYVYDSDLNLIDTLGDPTDAVAEIAFGPNGRMAVAVQSGNTLIYDSSLNLTDTLTDAEETVRGAAFNPSRQLATADGFSGEKALFYDSNLNLIDQLTDPTGVVSSVSFDSNGRLAVGSEDDNVYVYDPNTETTIFVSFSDLDLSNDGFSSPPTDAVVTHDFTPDTDDSQTIEYTVSDQSGNSVVISESQVGDIVDVSSLQDTTVSVRVDVTDDDLNASLNDFAIHFNE